MTPRHRSRLLVLATSISLYATATRAAPAAAPTTSPTTAPADDETARFVAEVREQVAATRRDSPTVAARKPDALVRLDLVDGHLSVRLADDSIEGVVNAPLDDGGEGVVRLNVQRIDAADPPYTALQVQLVRLDAAAGRAVHVEVYPRPGGTNLAITLNAATGATTAELAEQYATGIDFTATEPPQVRLYMSRARGEQAERVELVAPSFAALVEAHHDDVLAMMGEGLTALRAMHVLSGVSEADARAIFAAEGTIEPATDRALDAIIQRLDDEGSAAIPTVGPELRALGPAAATALARRPRADWSVDLSLNVDTLTADLVRVSDRRTAALFESPARLVNLLYAPQLDVRRGALVQLSRFGPTLPALDPAADPYSSVAAIEAIRSVVRDSVAAKGRTVQKSPVDGLIDIALPAEDRTP